MRVRRQERQDAHPVGDDAFECALDLGESDQPDQADGEVAQHGQPAE